MYYTEEEIEKAWRRLRNALNKKGKPQSNEDYRELVKKCLGIPLKKEILAKERETQRDGWTNTNKMSDEEIERTWAEAKERARLGIER